MKTSSKNKIKNAVDVSKANSSGLHFTEDNRQDHANQNEACKNVEYSKRTITQRQVFNESLGSNNFAPRPNNTDLPDNLKGGLEQLSGFDLSDVSVHYNSTKPAQLDALAYAQGKEIHLGSGQEKHLPHEGWHIVQQMQGRVEPTTYSGTGVPVNNDVSLEKEATVMGAKALQTRGNPDSKSHKTGLAKENLGIVQGVFPDEQINEKLMLLDQSGNFDIHDFITWQEKIDVMKPAYRTMGPEFEFAKLAVDVPIHVDLGKSKKVINGLPFVIETDAGNVIEIACPPFVIATSLDSFATAQRRSMIITEKIERVLKQMAQEGVEKGMTLRGLIQGIANLFGTEIEVTEVEMQHKDVKLSTFTKGVAAMTNEFFGKEHMSNAQINLKMTTAEIGKALRAATKGRSPNQFVKGIVTDWMFHQFRSEHYRSEEVEAYKDRIAIISYYFAQIPIMALQAIMNETRSLHKQAHQETKEQNRDNFKSSHPGNQKLLIRLSSIKDYLGFWIKASLNDMMRDDPEIKRMVLSINRGVFQSFIVSKTDKMWRAHKEGLEKYFGSGLGDAYNEAIGVILNNVCCMAQQEYISQPKKMSIPRHKDEGTTSELLHYHNGAPFMARPDTYVPLTGGHLVEVRGLNKKIMDNEFMRGFQMPYFRRAKKLADKETPDYYEIAKNNKNNPLQDWPEQIASQVSCPFPKITTGNQLKLVAESLAEYIEDAIDRDETLEEYTSDLISETVSAYAKEVNLPAQVREILDFLVAEIIYDENYQGAFDDLRGKEDYKKILELLGR